jgi:hypothetical protein
MRNTLFITCLLFCNCGQSQVYLEPFTGYAIDVRPKQNLHTINTGLQITFSNKSGYALSTGFINGFGVRRKSEDSSFTSNPSLPIYANAAKTTHSSFFGIYVNNGFRLFKIGDHQSVHFNLSFGLRLQRIKVNYKLDSPDYIVLNPGAEARRFGPYAGTGFEYLYKLKKGRIFFQTTVVTPSLGRRNEQPDRFSISVPLSFNMGYSFEIKKTKDQS